LSSEFEAGEDWQVIDDTARLLTTWLMLSEYFSESCVTQLCNAHEYFVVTLNEI